MSVLSLVLWVLLIVGSYHLIIWIFGDTKAKPDMVSFFTATKPKPKRGKR